MTEKSDVFVWPQSASRASKLVVVKTMIKDDFGNVRLYQAGVPEQVIAITYRARYFGGGQWYFICNKTRNLASVLWRCPINHHFFSARGLAKGVAYPTQFLSAARRAQYGQQEIIARMSVPGTTPLANFPDRPSRMKSGVYERLKKKFLRYDQQIEDELFAGLNAMLKRMGHRP